MITGDKVAVVEKKFKMKRKNFVIMSGLVQKKNLSKNLKLVVKLKRQPFWLPSYWH